MEHLGIQLRTVRKRLGKTLSEVTDNSARLGGESRDAPIQDLRKLAEQN